MEIVRLRSAGYTYEAIREALAEVGIELSTSALRREVRRPRGRSKAAPSGSPSTPRPAAVNTVSTPPPVPSPLLQPGSRGHDIAEAFFNDNPSHPLVQTKEIP